VKSKKRKLPTRKSSRANLYRSRRGLFRRTGNPVYGFLVGCFRILKLTFTVSFGVAAIGAFSLVLIMGYHQLTHATYFEVKEVVLKGLNRAREPEMVRITGLDKPANMFALRLGEMGEELRRHPWVKDVSLKRQMPETIIIEIVERQPVALLDIGDLYYMDDTGKPFKKLENEQENAIPVVTGFTRLDMIRRPDASRMEMEKVLNLLKILAERTDRLRLGNIAGIHFDRIRGMTIQTREERLQVEAGLDGHRVKLERLGRILAYLKVEGLDRGLAYINLECGPRVIIRYAGLG